MVSNDRSGAALNSWGWSHENVKKFIPDVKNLIWSPRSVNLSVRTDIMGRSWDAELVRNAFIQESQSWLSKRLIERAASFLPLEFWADYMSQNHIARRPVHDQFVETSRRELFLRNPNWWQEEAARRLEQFRVAKSSLNQKEPVTEALLIQKCIISSTAPLPDLRNKVVQYESRKAAYANILIVLIWLKKKTNS